MSEQYKILGGFLSYFNNEENFFVDYNQGWIDIKYTVLFSTILLVILFAAPAIACQVQENSISFDGWAKNFYPAGLAISTFILIFILSNVKKV